jgi:hypothetical protein
MSAFGVRTDMFQGVAKSPLIANKRHNYLGTHRRFQFGIGLVG